MQWPILHVGFCNILWAFKKSSSGQPIFKTVISYSIFFHCSMSLLFDWHHTCSLFFVFFEGSASALAFLFRTAQQQCAKQMCITMVTLSPAIKMTIKLVTIFFMKTVLTEDNSWRSVWQFLDLYILTLLKSMSSTTFKSLNSVKWNILGQRDRRWV